MRPRRRHVVDPRPTLLVTARREALSSSLTTMRAVRLSTPGPVDNLRLTTLPLPPERDGWVRIRVEAFGLNRSELKLRLGLSVGVGFPRGAGYRGRRYRLRGSGRQRAGRAGRNPQGGPARALPGPRLARTQPHRRSAQPCRPRNLRHPTPRMTDQPRNRYAALWAPRPRCPRTRRSQARADRELARSGGDWPPLSKSSRPAQPARVSDGLAGRPLRAGPRVVGLSPRNGDAEGRLSGR